MGNKTIHFCDFCQVEFGSSGTSSEPYKLVAKGNRYTDAAGSSDINQIEFELHYYCWIRLFNLLNQVGEIGINNIKGGVNAS